MAVENMDTMVEPAVQSSGFQRCYEVFDGWTPDMAQVHLPHEVMVPPRTVLTSVVDELSILVMRLVFSR